MQKKAGSPYRFCYGALIGSDQRGWIAYDGAYGRGSWHIHSLSLDHRDGIGYRLDEDPTAKYPRALCYLSKERALLALPALVEAGRLSTLQELAKAKEDYERRSAEYDRRETAKVKQEAEATRDALAGLRELLEGEPTNFQRSAIMYAIDKLERGK